MNANNLLVKWNLVMDALNLYVKDVKEQAIQQEREACAKVAEEFFKSSTNELAKQAGDEWSNSLLAESSVMIAKAIRSRK